MENQTRTITVKVILAIVAFVFLSGIMILQVMSAIQSSTLISNVGTIRAIGVGAYWDASLTNRTTTINWGTLDPGTQKSFAIYVRTEGNSAITLSLNASNWNPSTASTYMTLSWDYNGQTINVSGNVRVTLTLTVSASITGISNFNFDIVIVGSG